MRKNKGLSENERKITSLLNEGLFQAQIAERLKFSRSYVNQVIKRLSSVGLIQRIETSKTVDGRRKYTHLYSLSPELQSRVKGERAASDFTACRIHNLRMRFSWSSSSPVNLDKRTGYQKSWTMRGGDRHKYWYPGNAGVPSVTIDVHPKTLVVYVDKKQFIPAQTPDEAKEIGWKAVYAAVDSFVKQQERFGIKVETSQVGQTIGKPHGGFVGSDSPIMKEGVTVKDWWIDKSVESEVGPGKVELETDIPDGMTRLDNLIKISENPTEMFKSVIDPLNANVLQVQAMLQGGITISQQYEQMVNFMTKVLAEMGEMRKENAELKARLGL